MNNQPDLFGFDAAEAAREGARRALQHADDVTEGWGEAAYNALVAYAAQTPLFLVEDARPWAYRRGLPKPPTEHAWGSVVTRAVVAGIIAKDGFTNSRRGPGHSRPVTRWRSLVYEGAAQ